MIGILLTVGLPVLLVALAVTAMRVQRRREERDYQQWRRQASPGWSEAEQDEAIALFADRSRS
jgi:hypothetical protein